MKGKFFINLASVLSFFAISGELTAQVVKHERLLSFEEAVPQELSGAGSTLSLSELALEAAEPQELSGAVSTLSLSD